MALTIITALVDLGTEKEEEEEEEEGCQLP